MIGVVGIDEFFPSEITSFHVCVCGVLCILCGSCRSKCPKQFTTAHLFEVKCVCVSLLPGCQFIRGIVLTAKHIVLVWHLEWKPKNTAALQAARVSRVVVLLFSCSCYNAIAHFLVISFKASSSRIML